MTDLLAIDPGLNSPGAALFRDGVLIAAAQIKIPEGNEGDHGHRARAAAEAIAAWVDMHVAELAFLAYEWPQIYASSKNPNALLGMVAIDGAVSAMYPSAKIRSYLPSEWCGQLPKDTRKGKYWGSPRGVRIKSRLSEAEFAIVKDLNHDALDSVGIGLHSLGRLGIRKALASR